MNHLGVVLFSLVLFSSVSRADTITRTLDNNGQSIVYQLRESISDHSEREVVIEHQEERKFAPDTSVTALIGRDLDGDGFFDAWFFMAEDGTMSSVEYPSHEADGWDAAQVVLKAHTSLDNRILVGIVLGSLANRLTLAHSQEDALLKRLAMDEVELLDLQIRASRIAKMNPRDPSLLPIYETLSDGWAGISSQADIRTEILAGLGDVALYASGSIALEWLGRLGKVIASTARGTDAYAVAAEIAERMTAKFARRSEVALARIKSLTGSGARVAEAATALSAYASLKLTVKEQVSMLIVGLESRGTLGKLAAKVVLAGGELAKGTAERIPYLAMGESIQLVSEIYNNRGVLYDPNPIVMAKKVANDKDLIQNLLFMTVDSTLTSAVIVHNHNSAKGFAKAGVVSMVDSGTMNYFVKGSTDWGRISLDTGWQVGIGNLQTLIDMRALEYFEKMSERSANPKLKLVGYVVSGVDQFVGFFGYAKATSAYERHEAAKKNAITLTPVLAPAN